MNISTVEQLALQNAASSSMEGLALEQQHIEIIQSILDEKISLQKYLLSLKKQYEED